MKWDPPENHRNNCYFCQTFISTPIRKPTIHSIKYAEGSPAKRAKFSTDVQDETVDVANVEMDDDAAKVEMDYADYNMMDDDLNEASDMAPKTVSSSETVAAAENVSI